MKKHSTAPASFTDLETEIPTLIIICPLLSDTKALAAVALCHSAAVCIIDVTFKLFFPLLKLILNNGAKETSLLRWL